MTKWICVHDMTPPDLETVLASDGECVIVATYCQARGEFAQDTCQADYYNAEPLEPLAWQPDYWAKLPAAPEVEQ